MSEFFKNYLKEVRIDDGTEKSIHSSTQDRHLEKLSVFFENMLYDEKGDNFKHLLDETNANLKNLCDNAHSFETFIWDLFLIGESVYWRFMLGHDDDELIEVNFKFAGTAARKTSKEYNRLQHNFSWINRRQKASKFDEKINIKIRTTENNRKTDFSFKLDKKAYSNIKDEKKKEMLESLYKRTLLQDIFTRHEIKNTIEQVFYSKVMNDFFQTLKEGEINHLNPNDVFCYMLLEYMEEFKNIGVMNYGMSKKIGYVPGQERQDNYKEILHIIYQQIRKFVDYKKNIYVPLEEKQNIESYEKPYEIFCEIVIDIKREISDLTKYNNDSPSLKWMFEKIEKLKYETYKDIMKICSQGKWVVALQQLTNYSWLSVRYVELSKLKDEKNTFDSNPNNDDSRTLGQHYQSDDKLKLPASTEKTLNKIFLNHMSKLMLNKVDHNNKEVDKLKAELFDNHFLEMSLANQNVDIMTGVLKNPKKEKVIHNRRKTKKHSENNVLIANPIKVFGSKASLEKNCKSKQKDGDSRELHYEHNCSIKPMIRHSKLEKFSAYASKKRENQE